MAVFKQAHGLNTPAVPGGYKNDKEEEDAIHFTQLHDGTGVLDVKFFFRQDKFANPALLSSCAMYLAAVIRD